MAESIGCSELRLIDNSHINENPSLADIDKANEWFSIITKLQKSDGDMFLFGKITKNIFMTIERIYDANIERLTSDTIKSKPGFMLGILEHKNGNIYMAISEDPDEDINFDTKIQSLCAMLQKANFNVTIPETKFQSYLTSLTSTFVKNDDEGSSTAAPVDELPTNNAALFDTVPSSSTVVKTDGKENTISVQLINSEKYLEERKTGTAYLPVKKLKYDDTGFYLECNNGSTCVEAKLFSYCYDNLSDFNFGDIMGFAAYWVAKDEPPKHYMAKYSYCKLDEVQEHIACKSQDDEKLTKNTKDILRDIKVTYDDADLEKYKTILQPLALSCPGCLLNWSNYRNNRRSKFNYESCSPRKITYDQAKSLGGSYKSKLRKNVRNKKSKKRKNTLRIRNKANYKSKKKRNNKRTTRMPMN